MGKIPSDDTAGRIDIERRLADQYRWRHFCIAERAKADLPKIVVSGVRGLRLEDFFHLFDMVRHSNYERPIDVVSFGTIQIMPGHTYLCSPTRPALSLQSCLVQHGVQKELNPLPSSHPLDQFSRTTAREHNLRRDEGVAVHRGDQHNPICVPCVVVRKGSKRALAACVRL